MTVSHWPDRSQMDFGLQGVQKQTVLCKKKNWKETKQESHVNPPRHIQSWNVDFLWGKKNWSQRSVKVAIVEERFIKPMCSCPDRSKIQIYTQVLFSLLHIYSRYLHDSAVHLTSVNMVDMVSVSFLQQLLSLYHATFNVQVNVSTQRPLMNCCLLSLKASWGSDTVLS